MPISLITQQGEEKAICDPLNKFWKMHDQYNLQYLIPFHMKPSQGEKTFKTHHREKKLLKQLFKQSL